MVDLVDTINASTIPSWIQEIARHHQIQHNISGCAGCKFEYVCYLAHVAESGKPVSDAERYDASGFGDLELRDNLRARLVQIKCDAEIAEILIKELKSRGVDV
jgi:hypothetical protein